MLIKFSEISHTGIKREGTVSRDQFSKLEKRYQFDTLNYQAKLRQIDSEQVVVEVKYQVTVTADCDICLAPAIIELDESFSLDLITQGHDEKAEEDNHELTMDTKDTDFFDGHQVHLEKYIEDQLLLDLPLQVTCSDDCKGLCPSCGVNKNLKECDCDSNNTNSPFAVLKDMLGKP